MKRCDSCDYAVDNLHECENGMPRIKLELCDICYYTFVGNAAFYPAQYPERKVLATIAYIGNMLLDEIKAQSDKAIQPTQKARG